MVRSRAQVLAQSQDIHTDGAQIVHGFQDFLFGFAEPQHQAGLGKHVRTVLLGVLQDPEGFFIPGTRITNPTGQPLDGFHVLGKDIQPGIHHLLNVRHHRIKIRRQRLNGDFRRALFDGRDASGIVGSAAVFQVVTVYRGKHNITKAHQLYGLGRVLRLFMVKPAFRVAGVHRAEFAGPGTHRPHHHDGGRAGGPALTDIGAMRFLANGAQPVLTDVLAYRLIALAPGHACPEPFGLRLSLFRCCGFLLRRPLDAILDG